MTVAEPQHPDTRLIVNISICPAAVNICGDCWLLSAAVVTDKGRHAADVVVLACGERTPEMAGKVGVPFRLADKPSDIVVHTKPKPPILKHIVIGGELRSSSTLSLEMS